MAERASCRSLTARLRSTRTRRCAKHEASSLSSLMSAKSVALRYVLLQSSRCKDFGSRPVYISVEVGEIVPAEGLPHEKVVLLFRRARRVDRLEYATHDGTGKLVSR